MRIRVVWLTVIVAVVITVGLLRYRGKETVDLRPDSKGTAREVPCTMEVDDPKAENFTCPTHCGPEYENPPTGLKYHRIDAKGKHWYYCCRADCIKCVGVVRNDLIICERLPGT